MKNENNFLTLHIILYVIKIHNKNYEIRTTLKNITVKMYLYIFNFFLYFILCIFHFVSLETELNSSS